MPDQARVGANLKGPKARLLFRCAEPTLNVIPGKRHTQHGQQSCAPWSVADEVLDFCGLYIPGFDEPIGAIRRMRRVVVRV